MTAFKEEPELVSEPAGTAESGIRLPELAAPPPAPGVSQILGRSGKKKQHRAPGLRRLAVLLLVLPGLAAIAYAFVPPPLSVELGVVRRSKLSIYVSEDGRSRVRERYVVSAPISGELTRIALEPGDDVREGDVLFRLVPPAPALLDMRSRAEAESRLLAAEARKSQARSGVALMQTQYESALHEGARSRELATQGLLSDEQRDRAEVAMRLARENLSAAELSVRTAEADVRTARAVLGQVRRGTQEEIPMPAPASGRVLRVERESGGPVLVGSPVLEIGDVSQMEAVVDVLSGDALQIEPGSPVFLEHFGDAAEFTGHVRRVEPAAFTHLSALGIEEQRVNVIVTLDTVPPRLGDGYRVDARILIWEADQVLTVPSSATFRNGDAWAVFVVRDGRAVLQRVQLGRRGRLDAEVREGLNERMQVVLYPSDRIRSGARVEARE